MRGRFRPAPLTRVSSARRVVVRRESRVLAGFSRAGVGIPFAPTAGVKPRWRQGKPLRPQELGPAIHLAVARFREFEAVRRENEDLKKALDSRKIVERAKGLLMEREGLSEGQAFRRIQKASMDSRKSMVEVAEAILLAEKLR